MKLKKMPTSKLIHVGKIRGEGGKRTYLYLTEEEDGSYYWYNQDERTEIGSNTIEEAIRLAHREWKTSGFETLNCGFLYTLPERDEHGVNAYFHQMVASFSSLQGPYFDPEYGHMCVVQNPSHEALELLKQLEKDNE